MKSFTRYRGCRIFIKGDHVHVLGPKFIYLTKNEPGFLTNAVKYIDKRLDFK